MRLRRIPLRALLTVLLGSCAGTVLATGIQMSPLVGRRTQGLYRAASYNRVVDQYSRQAEEDYTVRLGNLRLQLSLALEAQYDDNLGRAADDPEDGLSLTPAIYSEIYWPLNPGFQVFAGINLGYKWYAFGGDEADDDGLVITGTDGAANAQLGFDLRLGQNGLLSLSEEYFRDLDLFEGGERGDSNYTVNRNLVNIQYRTEFSRTASGTAKITHTDQWVDEDEYAEQDHESNFLDLAVLRFVNRDVQVGAYGRLGRYGYTEDLHNDSEYLAGGLTLVLGTTERFVASGSVGLSDVSFDTTNNPEATDEYFGWTTQWAIRYSNSPVMTHRLVTTYGAEQGNLRAAVNFAKEWLVQYTLSYVLTDDLLVNADLGYINTRESDGGDNYNVYRIGIGFGYRLTRDTTFELRAMRDWSESDDRDGAEYTRDSLILRLVHRL